MSLARAAFLSVIFVLAIAVAVLGVFPEDDLVVSGWFWSPEAGFWLTRHGWTGLFRKISMWPTIALGVAALISVVQHILWPATRQFMAARTAVFLLVTITLAPVLLVNGVLKEHWHRARPVHVAEFGGPWTFTPWWQAGGSGQCRTNCSFISGEASGAAWLAAPALLAPPAWRLAALLAAGGYTVAVSALRIAYGGHFLSDVLLAALATLLIIAWFHHRLYRRPGHPSEAAMASALAGLGAWLSGLIRRKA